MMLWAVLGCVCCDPTPEQDTDATDPPPESATTGDTAVSGPTGATGATGDTAFQGY